MTDPLTASVMAGFNEFQKWATWLQDNHDTMADAFALLTPREQVDLTFAIRWMQMLGLWIRKDSVK
jgi:hypothetical protein